MVERRRTSVRGYIPAESIRPDAGIDFVLRRRGPARPRIETELREKMDEYAAEQGILGSMIEYIVHYQLTRRRLVPGVNFDFQSSLFGGRIELGGAVADFKFLDRPMIIRVMGEFWHCLAGKHRVLTADLRWVPIEALVPGDNLLAFEENGPRRKWCAAEVLSNEPVVRPAYEVRLSDGTMIVASSQHPWLTVYGSTTHNWRTTEKLIDKDYRQTKVSKLLEPWVPDESYDGGYLAGLLDGEGSLCQSPTPAPHGGFGFHLCLYQKQNPTLDSAEAILRQRGVDFTTRCMTNKSSWGKEVQQLSIRGGKLAILEVLGKLRPARLLDKFNPDMVGEIRSKRRVAIESKQFLGDQQVYGLTTSSGTYIAEGYGMHNSPWQAQGLGANDEEQRLMLEAWGWTVYDLWESTVMDNDRLEDWMVRKIDTPVVRGMWIA